MVTTVHERRRVEWAWRLLGLRAEPARDEIRAAFHKRAVATHPDRCTAADATARFQSLQAAYETALEHQAGRRGTRNSSAAACSSTAREGEREREREKASKTWQRKMSSPPRSERKRTARTMAQTLRRSNKATLELERRRLEIIGRRRRRPLSPRKRLICRALAAEASRRWAIQKLELNERRRIMLGLSEGRVRHVLMQWETACWANISQMWVNNFKFSG